MRFKEWNIASTLKHLWNLCNNKTTSIRVNWVRVYLMRNRNLWEIITTHDRTWAWRHILKFRNMARERTKNIIGNGIATSFWFNNLHPNSPLICKYGHQIIYDSSIPKNAMVNEAVDGTSWRWPMANSWDLMDMKIVVTFSPSSGEEKVIWTPSSGCFSTK